MGSDFFAIDDVFSKIGNLKPTDAGYANAALDRALVNIRSTQTPGIYQLDNGQYVGQFPANAGNNSNITPVNNAPRGYTNIGASYHNSSHMIPSQPFGCDRFHNNMFGGENHYNFSSHTHSHYG